MTHTGDVTHDMRGAAPASPHTRRALEDAAAENTGQTIVVIQNVIKGGVRGRREGGWVGGPSLLSALAQNSVGQGCVRLSTPDAP